MQPRLSRSLRLVFDHDGLLEGDAQRLRDDAGDRVGAAAWSERKMIVIGLLR